MAAQRLEIAPFSSIDDLNQQLMLYCWTHQLYRGDSREAKDTFYHFSKEELQQMNEMSIAQYIFHRGYMFLDPKFESFRPELTECPFETGCLVLDYTMTKCQIPKNPAKRNQKYPEDFIKSMFKIRVIEAYNFTQTLEEGFRIVKINWPKARNNFIDQKVIQ